MSRARKCFKAILRHGVQTVWHQQGWHQQIRDSGLYAARVQQIASSQMWRSVLSHAFKLPLLPKWEEMAPSYRPALPGAGDLEEKLLRVLHAC